MPKRKFEGEGEDSWPEESQRKPQSKNSLDSDEEDDEPESNKYHLKDDDIEGQEEGNIMHEEGVQFTPFNMREEMEEGHFDTNGMYHWKKEKQVKDSWLENIDWVKIKDTTKEGDKGKNAESDDELPEAFDSNKIYKDILSYLKPKETIAKALQRLGGKKSLSASERLKLKKAGLLPSKDELNSDSESVTALTELANKILNQLGNMDIYQETFEHITNMLNASESKAKKEPVLDMYADDFGSKEKELLNESSSTNAAAVAATEPMEGNNIMWEFKREKDSSKLEGPYTTQQMEKWAQSGHFGKGVFVRKCGSSQFYNSTRVDFDLYL